MHLNYTNLEGLAAAVAAAKGAAAAADLSVSQHLFSHLGAKRD